MLSKCQDWLLSLCMASHAGMMICDHEGGVGAITGIAIWDPCRLLD